MKADKVIYSQRKSLAISISNKGEVIVKAPKFIKERQIEIFLNQNMNWIERKRKEALKDLEKSHKLIINSKQKVEYKKEARKIFLEKLERISKEIDIKYQSFRLSSAKKRWGSCNSRGKINLNWRLILTKHELIDYVILHELAHVKHLNHSKNFWDFVKKYDPNYKQKKKELKKYEYLFLLD